MANTATAQTGANKILVVWYSWGGNTHQVGNYIRELANADVFVIEPIEPYSTIYNECTREAKIEIEAGRQRPINGRVENMDDYDTVIIGTPNWWSTMAPPVLAFIREHKLTGKTVAPFVTHGGGREARCFSDMQREVPDARFLKGLVISGNRAGTSRDEVEKWLRETGILR